MVRNKADDRTRTDNLLITNQLLCQLSHIGICIKEGPTKWEDSLIPTPVGGTHEVGGFLNTLNYISVDLTSFTGNDSNGNRTRVTAVKGRCLNRLTMEPYIFFYSCCSIKKLPE